MYPVPAVLPEHARHFEYAVLRLRLAVAKCRVGRVAEQVRGHLDAAGRCRRPGLFARLANPSLN